MGIQEDLPEEIARNIKKGKIEVQEETIQYNKQDLDQEQRVDVNPVQLNTQNINIHVINDITKYYGKITGTIYLDANKEIVINKTVFLYFGNERFRPVYQTNSDYNGNFVIEDIPPGYYTLVVGCGANSSRSNFIKVLPGQIEHQAIILKDRNPAI